MMRRPARRRTVVSWFEHDARRIGSLETFAYELSLQLKSQGWSSVLCFEEAPPDPVREYLSAAGARLVAHHLGGNRAGVWRILRQVLAAERPMAFHTHFISPLDRAHWESWSRGVPIIFNTDHSSRPAGWVPRPALLPKRALGRIFSAPLSRLVTVSEFIRGCHQTLGYVAPSKLKCIHNGVDTATLQADTQAGLQFRKEYGLRPDSFVVMQISHMIAQKGIRDLIEAARVWLPTNPKIQLCLVGDGRDLAEFRAEAQAGSWGDAIVFTGLVPDLRAAHSAADVVVQVSRWQEAFGAVIAEAMSCARPVIASRAGGIPEIVVPGETGLLVNPGEPGEIAAAVLQLAADEGLRRRMGREGRARACRLFDIRTNVAQLVSLYLELAKRGNYALET